ncbi:hypothetical protein Tco_0692841 [Tanacetum coccineum]
MNQSPINELRATSNSTDLWDMRNVAIHKEIQTDLAIARQLMVAVREIQAKMQDKEMACVGDLLVKINEVLRRPVEKEEFLDYVKRL